MFLESNKLFIRPIPNPETANPKGQLISKANCQAVNSSKKQTNECVFTSMRRVFLCFSEEIEDSKKAFRNYLTFKSLLSNLYTVIKVVKESMYPDQDFCL